ncbi:hypothetical protein Hypma_005397 [Hypsizygus marmoreus]|uniref:Protein CPL1-like domain-containing protein n=1 Tax=Hypsizygus marmoreus TaxID=39966 RepID=A0A369JWL1_HYPMA|nr:hypothetical protein Hypma_005397 [Hypsizygus marmoreus]
MRLSTAFFVSSLAGLFLPSIAAAQYPRDGLNTPRSVLSTRQYKVPRAIIDTCISITGDVFAVLAGIIDPGSYVDLRICVCLQDLDIWLDTNADAQILIGLLGREAVRALLNVLLAIGPTNPLPEECTFPDHSQRICVAGEPCAFECTDGYTEENGVCVCAPPNLECNGVCGSFPGGCSSAVPRKRRSLPVTTLARAKSTCKRKESVCGIPGREDTLDFECVDTSIALDSCGGCVVPHPFYEPDRSSVLGIDCGHLPGVITATCARSQCLVLRCRGGQEPSADGTQCVAVSVVQQLLGSNGPLRLNTMKRRDILANDVGLGADLNLDVDVAVDAIVNGTGPLLADLAAVLDVDVSIDLQAKISALVKLVASINSGASLPTIAGLPAPLTSNLLDGVINATVNVLGSSSLADLSANIDILLNASVFLGKLLDGLEVLGLVNLKTTLDLVVEAVVDLKDYTTNNVVASTSIPVIANASDLIKALRV